MRCASKSSSLLSLPFFQVTYNKVAKNETHKNCYQPLERRCDGEPAKRTVCKDWPETFCSTKYVESKTDGGQFVADTSCERVDTRVCVPVNCAMIPGEEKCHEKLTTIVREQPEEVEFSFHQKDLLIGLLLYSI